MTVQDILILLLLAGWLAAALIHMCKKRGSCTGCEGCRACGGCGDQVNSKCAAQAERTCNMGNGKLQ